MKQMFQIKGGLMRLSITFCCGTLLALAACTTPEPEQPSPYLSELSETVLQLAAPYQDLTAVQIDPVDNCYVYRHVGVVETTMLPLRTAEGRPICRQVVES